MVVLEGDQPLGADAHRYYDDLVKRIEADTKHVQHVQDFWGDPLTAAGSQSPDGKAAYVQVFLSGNQGEALSLESVDALREIVAKTPAPPGVKAYVAGAAPQIADQFEVGNKSTTMVTLLTVGVIAIMLLIVYRSFVTMILALVTVLIEMSAARGVVAFLANSGFIGLSTYSTNILTLLVIAAGTDYVIFLLGRYHESRNGGEDRKAAYYDMYRGTAHVDPRLGADHRRRGLLPELHPHAVLPEPGRARRIGVLVSLVASLTLAPAVIVIGSRFGLLEPKRATAQARLAADRDGDRALARARSCWPPSRIALIGLLALPGYKTSYDVSEYLPGQRSVQHRLRGRRTPLLQGAAESRVADDRDRSRSAQPHRHDPAGARRQGRLPHRRHRPGPIDHPTAGHALGPHVDPVPDQRAERGPDPKPALPAGPRRRPAQAGRRHRQIHQHPAPAICAPTTSQRRHRTSRPKPSRQTVAIAQDLRDKIANFDDFFRPLRNYFYWEPHCFDIPVCAALRSLFDSLDGIDALTDQLGNVSASIAKLDELQPKLLALIPPQIATQQANRDLTMTNYATTSGIYDQTAAALQNSTALGQAYDASKTDDSFYLPPEAFTNPEFLRGLKLFLSPDGKAARMIITHDVDPATPEGISHIDAISHAAQEAIKGTPLAGSRIYIGGMASTYRTSRRWRSTT